jgi:integrase
LSSILVNLGWQYVRITIPSPSPVSVSAVTELLVHKDLSSEVGSGKTSLRPVGSEGNRLARRRYQKGSLLLLNKNWFGRYYEDVIQDGKIRRPRVQVFLGTTEEFPTRRLARRALDRRLERINDLAYRPSPTATVAQFNARWDAKVSGQLKGSTSLSYKGHIRNHLNPFFGPLQLSDIRTELVQQFIASRTVAPKTVRNILVTLQSLWRTARAWGYVTHDIFDGLVLPTARRTQRFFFSPEDVQRIVRTAKEPHCTFYGLLAETGMRVGELCGLRVDDIDLERGVLFVRQSAWRGKLVSLKTKNSERVIELSPPCIDHLRKFLMNWVPNANRLVFATRNGTPRIYRFVEWVRCIRRSDTLRVSGAELPLECMQRVRNDPHP